MKLIKKIEIILYIFVLIQIVLILVSNPVRAEFFNNVFEAGKEFEQTGANEASSRGIDTSNVVSPLIDIFSTLRVIGAVVSIIYLLYLIFQSAQTVRQSGEISANAKMKLGGATIISALLLFAPRIWAALVTAFDNLSNIA